MIRELHRRKFLSAMALTAAGSALPPRAYSMAVAGNSRTRPWNSSDVVGYGADYYAEDWPAERLEVDAKLMQQARFRTVRMADTNWERLEPEEGRYDFAWLDRAVEALNRCGIRSVLCTSSYVPPAWLVQKHPDFYLVNEAGVRRRWGGMGMMCLNNPLYLGYVTKLVKALAAHFGENPAVIGWQIDNEMGLWGAECYDEHYCIPKFRQHLKAKFGTLDELNRRLLTVSYGHSYSSWDQIPLRTTVPDDALQAPLVLECKRFFSSNVGDFLAFQAGLLRQYASRKQFVTTNSPNPGMNCFDFAKHLDFMCLDSYPRVGDSMSSGFEAEIMRGFNRGKSFQVFEFRCGTFGGYTLDDATPPPGLVRLWAWQTLAHGADGLLFFRWRMNNGGSEQYWQGLLNYDGTPSPVFAEVVRMGEELQKAGPEFVHAETHSQVAQILSYESLWALQIGDDKFPYWDQLKIFSSSFRRLGMNVDCVAPDTDFSKYRIVIAPSLHLTDAAIVESLDSFVQNGGTLVLTARSGFKNQDNLATQIPPGPFERLAQVRVRSFTLLERSSAQKWLDFPEEQGGYKPSPDNAIESASPEWPGTYKAKYWADILEPDGARTLFKYQKDFFAGQAAVTAADYGKGKVIYVGTMLESRFYMDLLRRACGWAGIDCGPAMPDGVDVTIRSKDRKSFRFVLNFNDSEKSVPLAGTHRDLLTGKTFVESVSIPAFDLRILVRDQQDEPGSRS